MTICIFACNSSFLWPLQSLPDTNNSTMVWSLYSMAGCFRYLVEQVCDIAWLSARNDQNATFGDITHPQVKLCTHLLRFVPFSNSFPVAFRISQSPLCNQRHRTCTHRHRWAAWVTHRKLPFTPSSLWPSLCCNVSFRWWVGPLLLNWRWCFGAAGFEMTTGYEMWIATVLVTVLSQRAVAHGVNCPNKKRDGYFKSRILS